MIAGLKERAENCVALRRRFSPRVLGAMEDVLRLADHLAGNCGWSSMRFCSMG